MQCYFHALLSLCHDHKISEWEYFMSCVFYVRGMQLVSTLLYLILMTNIDFYAHHCQHSLEDAIPSSPILNSLSWLLWAKSHSSHFHIVINSYCGTKTVFCKNWAWPSTHSFHGRESKGSPKKRVDVRPSRTSSIERNKEKENSLNYSSDSENKRNSVKESDENKENMIMNSELKEDSVFYQDEEVLNDSIISGKESHLYYKDILLKTNIMFYTSNRK